MVATLALPLTLDRTLRTAGFDRTLRTPAKSGNCIKPSDLRPSDIIVTRSSGPIGRIICEWTNSNVSHSMLAIGNQQIVEAKGTAHPPEVHFRAVSTAISDAVEAVAFRHPSVTPSLGWDIAAMAAAYQGQPYDTWGAIGAGLARNPGAAIVTGWRVAGPAGAIVGAVASRVAANGAFNGKNAVYCSELIILAYRANGLRIVNGSPGTSEPRDFLAAYNAGTLEYVGHLKG